MARPRGCLHRSIIKPLPCPRKGVARESGASVKVVNPESTSSVAVETKEVVAEEEADPKRKRKRVAESDVEGVQASKKVSMRSGGVSSEEKLLSASLKALSASSRLGLVSPGVEDAPKRDLVFSVLSEAGVDRKQILNCFDEDLLSAEDIFLLRRSSPTRISRRRLELLRTYSLLGFLEKENPVAKLKEQKQKVIKMEEVVRSHTAANDELVAEKKELLSDKGSLEKKVEEDELKVKEAENRAKEAEDWFAKQADQVAAVLEASSNYRTGLTRTEARIGELDEEVERLKADKKNLEELRVQLDALKAEKKRCEDLWLVEKKNLAEKFAKLKSDVGARLKAAEDARGKALDEQKKAKELARRVYLKSFNNAIE